MSTNVIASLVRKLARHAPSKPGQPINHAAIVKEATDRVISFEDPGHGAAHLEIVMTTALQLAQTTDRRDVVALAALCHDIKDSKFTKEPFDVATFLVGHGVDASAAADVATIVDHVSWSAERKLGTPAIDAVIARVPELAPVQDADRIDADGAMGFYRVFSFIASKRWYMRGDAVVAPVAFRYRALKQAQMLPAHDLLAEPALMDVLNAAGAVGHYEAKLGQLHRCGKTPAGKIRLAEEAAKLQQYMDDLMLQWRRGMTSDLIGDYGIGLHGVKSKQHMRHILRAALHLIEQGQLTAPVQLDGAMAYGVAEHVAAAFDELTPAEAQQFRVITKIHAKLEDRLEEELTAHVKVLLGQKKHTPIYAILLHNPGDEYRAQFPEFVQPAQALLRLYKLAQKLGSDCGVPPLVGICNPPHSLQDLQSMYGLYLPLVDVIQGQFQTYPAEMLQYLQTLGMQLMLSRPFMKGQSLKVDGVVDGGSSHSLLQAWQRKGVHVIPALSHKDAVLDDFEEVLRRMCQHVGVVADAVVTAMDTDGPAVTTTTVTADGGKRLRLSSE